MQVEFTCIEIEPTEEGTIDFAMSDTIGDNEKEYINVWITKKDEMSSEIKGQINLQIPILELIAAARYFKIIKNLEIKD